MGEIAEMMLNGELCEGCGVYMGVAQGFTRHCHSCSVETPARTYPKVIKTKEWRAAHKKVSCVHCGKWVSTIGMPDHVKNRHGTAAKTLEAKL